MGPAYIPFKTAWITFSDEYNGLLVKVRTNPKARTYHMLLTAGDDLQKSCEAFAEIIVAWNLRDAHGDPIGTPAEATKEGEVLYRPDGPALMEVPDELFGKIWEGLLQALEIEKKTARDACGGADYRRGVRAVRVPAAESVPGFGLDLRAV
jgi:hypothetical protein